MTFNLVVKSINKATDVETSERYLDVEFDLVNDEDLLVATRKLAFPLEFKQKAIEADLKKYLETFTLEQEMAVAQAEIDKADKNADNVINNLEGLTL